jgi:hypothetical protein
VGARTGQAVGRGREIRDAYQICPYWIGCCEPHAFNLARGVLVARTPPEILVVESVLCAVPATVAGAAIDQIITTA